jgi:hypothetical protein
MFQQGISVRFSADGIHWSAPIACKEISAAGDTHNNALWVPELGKYVGITRRNLPERVVVRTESPDFLHWTKATEIYRGDPDHQAYAMPIFRYANVYLGLVMIFRAHSDDRVACELAWSPDTVTWSAVDKGTPIIPLSEKPGDYDWGCVYAAATPVVLANEIRLYYGASNGPHTGWRDGFLALATLRKDGWAGYVPVDSQKSGIVVTKPIVCTGPTLRVSADASAGSLKVIVVGPDGKDAAVSKPLRADVTDGAVAWEGENPLASRHGQMIQFRFELESAKLYAFACGK